MGVLVSPHNNRSRITPEHKDVGFAIAQQPFFRRQIKRGVCARIIDKTHTPPHKTHYWDISHFLHLSKRFADARACRHEGAARSVLLSRKHRAWRQSSRLHARCFVISLSIHVRRQGRLCLPQVSLSTVKCSSWRPSAAWAGYWPRGAAVLPAGLCRRSAFLPAQGLHPALW